jgi:hypothetical protein
MQADALEVGAEALEDALEQARMRRDVDPDPL